MPAMTSGLQVFLTESRNRLPLDRVQWNTLAAQNPTHTAFQTFEWFDAWWSAFGARHRLFLLTVHQGQEVIGIAPLMQIRGRMGLREIEFVGSPNSDYQDLILGTRRAEAVAAICAYLYGARNRWNMLVLRNLPAESPSVGELIREFGRLGLGAMDMERQPCPALLVGGRESEIQQLLNRYSVRRGVRRLESRGPLSFRVFDSGADVDRWLPEFFDQHIQRWKNTGSPSPFADEAFRDWYRILAHAALAAGWLHFSLLECGGRPAAFHFGFNHGGVLYWYKPSFSPEFARQSPGTALISNLIKDARDRGLKELDFAAGQEPFKDRFSNLRRECLNLRVFSAPLLHAAFMAGGHLRQVARNWWHRARGRKVGIDAS